MGTTMEGAPLQTLGQRIRSLGVGHPCPCCGAPLKAALPSRSARPPAPAPRAGGEEQAVLCCPQCGCEVSEADDSRQAADGIGYGVAA